GHGGGERPARARYGDQVSWHNEGNDLPWLLHGATRRDGVWDRCPAESARHARQHRGPAGLLREAATGVHGLVGSNGTCEHVPSRSRWWKWHMSDWRDRYRHKLISAEDAVRLVKDGMIVQFGQGTSTPMALMPLLAARRHELSDVIAYGDVMFYDGDWDDPTDTSRHIEVRAFMLSAGGTRTGYLGGRVQYAPATCWTAPRRWDRDIGGEHGGPDIALLRLSEPDGQGLCSFGAHMWDNKITVRRAKCVVAEIQEGMIRTAGDNWVHVDDIDYLVEVPPPAPREIVVPALDPEHAAVLDVIGAFAAELVPDGATVEVGTGHASNAVVPHLAGKHDLGYHSELTAPGIAALYEAGVLKGPGKTRHTGKMVVTALPPYPHELEIVQRHYDDWELYGIDYTHNPAVISSQYKMTAINAGLMVDLTGQIVFDSVGRRMHSGPGGQLEFVIGAV